MNTNIVFTVMAIVLAWLFLIVGDQVEALDATKTIQGTFKQANNNLIWIIEYPDGKEVKIEIDPNTVYDNVQKLEDLKVGDKVQIDYKRAQDNYTAITVTKLEAEN